MDTFPVTVVTPEGVFLKSEAELLEVPTVEGEIGIYAGHAPMIAAISVGQMRVYREGAAEYFALAGGFVQVSGTGVRLLASFAGGEPEGSVEEALERARRALEDMALISEEQVKAELAFLQSQLIHLSERKKSRRPSA